MESFPPTISIRLMMFKRRKSMGKDVLALFCFLLLLFVFFSFLKYSHKSERNTMKVWAGRIKPCGVEFINNFCLSKNEYNVSENSGGKAWPTWLDILPPLLFHINLIHGCSLELCRPSESNNLCEHQEKVVVSPASFLSWDDLGADRRSHFGGEGASIHSIGSSQGMVFWQRSVFGDLPADLSPHK